MPGPYFNKPMTLNATTQLRDTHTHTQTRTRLANETAIRYGQECSAGRKRVRLPSHWIALTKTSSTSTPSQKEWGGVWGGVWQSPQLNGTTAAACLAWLIKTQTAFYDVQ